MAKSLFLVFVVLSVIAVTIQAAAIHKRQATDDGRPEAPLLSECEEPGDNRENCFTVDPDNVYVYKLWLEDIQEWEKKNPKAADDFNKKNPDEKKKLQDKLVELEKFAKIHE